MCGLCCGCSSCLAGREGKQIEEGVFAEMVLQHLRGFVQGVRGTFADLAGYVILDVSRRRSGELAEQLSPGGVTVAEKPAPTKATQLPA